MELGFTPRLLQPQLLGRMGAAISPAGGVVSTATDPVDESSRIRWELALSTAELCAAASRSTSAGPTTMERNESSGIQTPGRISAPRKPAAGKASGQSAAGNYAPGK